jgi:hypothetical protein
MSQVSVLIIGAASKAAIKRAAAQDDAAFEAEFADPYAWLQWLAGMGVLWLSSDFKDAGFASIELWSNSLGLIIKQLFMSKPKKGLVIVLWGPEAKKFKKEVLFVLCCFMFMCKNRRNLASHNFIF